MGDINGVKSLNDIINIIKINDDTKITYIPLIQRNYKWSMECAAEFAESIWRYYKNNKVYQLNMITLYRKKEKNNREELQILDGQQRLITLKLLLTFFIYKNEKEANLDFKFERDFNIKEEDKREIFINKELNKELKKVLNFDKSYDFTVDKKRLYDNYIAMVIPLSFKTVFKIYCELENKKFDKKTFLKKVNDKIDEIFKVQYNNEISKNIKQKLKFEENEEKDIYTICKDFLQEKKNIENKDDYDEEMGIEVDKVRESKFAQEFLKIWTDKIKSLDDKVDEKEIEQIRSNIYNRKEILKFIKNRVEILYHETNVEPISEYLNINQNKTRFTISDYIRAYMIKDNPIEENNKYISNRKETLELFNKIAEYFYNDKDMWELVKKRYDNFDKYKDKNRMKIVFDDRYTDMSMKGYNFENELKTLKYYRNILDAISNELKVEKNGIHIMQ